MLFNTCMRLNTAMLYYSFNRVTLIINYVFYLHSYNTRGYKISEKYRNRSVSDFGDTDTLKLIRYPILRVLGIGFVPSLRDMSFCSICICTVVVKRDSKFYFDCGIFLFLIITTILKCSILLYYGL